MTPRSSLNGMRNGIQTAADDFLDAHPAVKYVLFLVHDYGNIARCILTTARRARHVAAHPEDTGAIGSVSCQAYACWGVSGTQDDWGKVMRGSDHWVPHWHTLRRSWRPDQAVVLCSFKEMCEAEGSRFERDPRCVLERIVRRATAEHDLDFKVGYEIEFSLLDSIDEALVPEHDTNKDPEGAYNMAAVRGPKFDVLLKMVDALEEAGIRVWNFHAELDSGEFEISLSPSDPLSAVDDLLHANNMIRSIAKKRGMHATMHPQRYADGPTIGQHAHVSLNRDECADPFLSGIVEHLRGISAVLMGAFDSYGSRNNIIGHGDVSWGRAKNVPLRRFGHSRFEIRTPDCLSNPYLQLAAILGTGLDAVSRGAELKMKENTWSKQEPMDEVTKAKIGVTQSLPETMLEAVQAMEEDAETLRTVLGDKCFDAYLNFRRVEETKSRAMTRAERTRALVQHI